MAKKKTAKKPGGSSKAKPADASPGHNAKVNRALTKEYFEDLDNLHKEKAETSSGYASRIGNLYEKAANELGVGKKALQEAYGEHQFEKKKIARRKEMTPEQQQDVDRVILAAASYKTSPLFMAAQDREERQQAAKEMGGKDEGESKSE
jgi:hypothetical protein